jgi:hypothetical protein
MRSPPCLQLDGIMKQYQIPEWEFVRSVALLYGVALVRLFIDSKLPREVNANELPQIVQLGVADHLLDRAPHADPRSTLYIQRCTVPPSEDLWKVEEDLAG